MQIPCGGSSATGDTVHFTAYWQNMTTENGPAVLPISVSLPAGGVMPKAMHAATPTPKLRAA